MDQQIISKIDFTNSTYNEKLNINKVKGSILYSSTNRVFFVCRILGVFPLAGLLHCNKSKLR